MFANMTVKQLRSLIRQFKEHHNIKNSSKMKKAQLVAELENRFVIKDNKLYLKDEIPQQQNVNTKTVNAKTANAKTVNAKSVNAKTVNAKTTPQFTPQPPPNFTGQMTEQRKQDALAKRVIAQAKNAKTINKFRKIIDYEKDKQH
jgi:hypothetical protein